jgi:AcrR family transcriptional regulator
MEGSVLTPWGRSDQLRDRRLRPGPGKQRAEVERNHRERLFGAMVAVVDEAGYEGMNVGAVASRAGVSRGTLYEYFPGGGRDCFLATFEALLDEGLATVGRAYAGADGTWDARLAHALDALFDVLVEQPAAARLCFLEGYASGTAGAELRERGSATLEGLVRDALDQSPPRRDMPSDVVCALVGGVRTVAQARLRRRTEGDLPGLVPELMRWLTVYERPDPELRPVPASAPPAPRFVATSHRDRLFVALAKVVHAKGYTATNVSDVVTAAGVSLSTFYENFDGKEAAFLAACDFGIEQAFASVRFAWERAAPAGWPAQVRAGMRELLAFLASEPEWSQVAMVEIFGAGARARSRRDRTIALFTELVEPGRALQPAIDPIVIEALGGAVYSLMYGQIARRGAQTLPEILPATVFVLLAPFVGNVQAAQVADRSDTTGPSPSARRHIDR